MPLTLTISKVDRPAGLPPPPLRLDRRGAVIGRAADADWVLPDDRATVSSRHCEIAFRDGAYLIADSSTNGTYLNGARLTAPQRLGQGDVIGIGPYQIAATLSADAPPRPAAPPQPSATGFPAAGTSGSPADHLLRHAGLRRADVTGSDAEILAAAGALLRQMAAGTKAMLDARAVARSQIGAAAAPAPPFDGGTAEQALARLLVPGGERPAADAFADLEAHQLATLKAMQGAMKATLDRFAPPAIRARAGAKAGEAALWREYESAFAGTGKAPEDAFIEVFARELRAAYEELAKRR